MSADFHIHVAVDVDEEDFKCFFSNGLGSKWHSWGYKCEEEKRREEVFHSKIEILDEEYPQFAGLPMGTTDGKTFTPYSKERMNRWYQLLKEYYEEVDYECSHRENISNTPSINVGEVSWLKAALFNDSDTFIPGPIEKLSELIGEDLPVIDEEFIRKVGECFEVPNQTKKEGGVWNGVGYYVSQKEDVIKFLRRYMGERVFSVSW